MKYYHKSQSGFTLLELLVAMGISLIVLLAASTLMIDAFRDNAILWEQLKTQAEGRTVLNQVVNMVRKAESSSVGGYPIVEASDYSFTFYANIDEDNLRERVQFYLQNGNLYRSVIKPSGNPLSYSTSTASTVTVAEYVINEIKEVPIFLYYDESYTGGQLALTAPIDIPSIRVLKVQLELERDPTKTPIPLHVESLVSVRNLKEN